MPGAQGRASVISGAGLGLRGGGLLPALAMWSLKGGTGALPWGSLAVILQGKKIVATHSIVGL